jgi:hypothetical protein
VRGRRLALGTRRGGYVYDHRACSDPFRGPVEGTPAVDNRWWVAVCAEDAWWTWALTGEQPQQVLWPVTAGRVVQVFVEDAE